MINQRLIALFGLLSSWTFLIGSGATAQEASSFLPLPKAQVALNTTEGRRLLSGSEFQESFWQLSQYFNIQADLGSCGVATSTMILNSLPIERPVSQSHGTFRLFTASNLFTDRVKGFLTQEKVSRSGMTLDQFGKLLESHGASVTVVHASDSSLEAFRKCLSEALRNNEKLVAVNYLRRAIGQQTGGHISPIAAFSKESDKVLILDTSSYKYPWTWVPLKSLWSAMSVGVDSGSERTRGFVVAGGSNQPDPR